jgi:hypothetical protein
MTSATMAMVRVFTGFLLRRLAGPVPSSRPMPRRLLSHTPERAKGHVRAPTSSAATASARTRSGGWAASITAKRSGSAAASSS